MIDALPRQHSESLSGNVWRAFQYLRDRFTTARVVDPANTNNIVSDDLTIAQKNKVKALAEQALGANNWNEIVT